jgi:hypothetical protein
LRSPQRGAGDGKVLPDVEVLSWVFGEDEFGADFDRD